MLNEWMNVWINEVSNQWYVQANREKEWKNEKKHD